jgi:hypothetical protein
MLHWCLTELYQPDGSFKENGLDDTLGDAYEYGVDFLTDAGYFDGTKRFWTNQSFPEAGGVRDRIETKLKSIGLRDGLKDAYQTLLTGQE